MFFFLKKFFLLKNCSFVCAVEMVQHSLKITIMETIMKNNFKTLTELEINFDLFYVITFRKGEIQLQGNATAEAITECKKIVDTLSIDDQSYLVGKKGIIEVTLTF